MTNHAEIDVTVVLVGYNSRDNLEECLGSLSRTDWGQYRASTWFVDNASTDGSVEFVREFAPGIQIIRNSVNRGFSEACNQAAAASRSRYLYLLNNDTRLLPDSIPLLVRFLDSETRAAAAGNRLLNTDGTDQWSARRFPRGWNAIFGRRSTLSRMFPNLPWVRNYLYKDELERNEPFQVDWIPGSCTLVRRDAYQQVNGLPPAMHYWGDAVFCARLRKAGWSVFTVPKAVLYHQEGEGTGRKDNALKRWLIEDFHRGAFRFYCEHYGLRPGSLAHWAAQTGLNWRARALISLRSVADR